MKKNIKKKKKSIFHIPWKRSVTDRTSVARQKLPMTYVKQFDKTGIS